jgi:Lon protease-like protein
MVLPSEVPVMTLPNAILFPGALLPLYIFEPRYRRMLSECLHSHRVFAIAMQKPGCTRAIPCAVAGMGLVRVAVTRRDGTSYVVLQGLVRVELTTVRRYRPFRLQQFRPLEDAGVQNSELPVLTDKLRRLVLERVRTETRPAEESHPMTLAVEDAVRLNSLALFSLQHFLHYLAQLQDPGQMADLVSCTMLPGATERQIILETVNLHERLKRVIDFLSVNTQDNPTK